MPVHSCKDQVGGGAADDVDVAICKLPGSWKENKESIFVAVAVERGGDATLEKISIRPPHPGLKTQNIRGEGETRNTCDCEA